MSFQSPHFSFRLTLERSSDVAIAQGQSFIV